MKELKKSTIDDYNCSLTPLFILYQDHSKSILIQF